MKLICIVVGVAIGIGLHIAWQRITNKPVMIEGIVKIESPQDPAITPSYPPGCYVESRIYLHTADTNLLGKSISMFAYLGATRHPEAPSYPLVTKKWK